MRNPQIDLTKVIVPVFAINGELDRPHCKTTRMARELFNFTNVVLPGKSHLTAISAATIPRLYIDRLEGFINSHDRLKLPRGNHRDTMVQDPCEQPPFGKP